ncbi:MAG TPA: TetR/AcrR family transcriptional regulator [Candidatus Luteococcus avicola]|nr:TetR/AcrR family transcriptional regulator [Candidatus Luteococcus avicola]
MVANPDRRTTVCDAALHILGCEGPRSLTHRAVDREAALPLGTTSNYFPTRSALFAGMTRRLFEALTPDPARLEQLATLPAHNAGSEYVAYIVERLLAQPHLGRAWFELRLEAHRSPEIAALVTPVLQEGFAQDVAFHQERGLPGDTETVRTLHHLVDGLVFDALTSPVQPESDPIELARQASQALLSP